MIKQLRFKLFRYLVSKLSKDYESRTSAICTYCNETTTWHQDVPCYCCKKDLIQYRKIKEAVKKQDKEYYKSQGQNPRRG